MNGLSCTAWRDHPSLVERARHAARHAAQALRREGPWPTAQRVGAAVVVAWIVVGWIYVVPLALYLARSNG